MECDCELEEGAIDQDHLLCDQSQLNKTVFRAEIVTYQLTSDELLIIIENMVTAGRLMVNESTVITLDRSCPIKLLSFNDPVCAITTTDNVENRETQTSNNNDDDSSSIGIIIGSICAVIIFIILLIIFFSLLIFYWRYKRR